jgi:hypothetical protein
MAARDIAQLLSGPRTVLADEDQAGLGNIHRGEREGGDEIGKAAAVEDRSDVEDERIARLGSRCLTRSDAWRDDLHTVARHAEVPRDLGA